MEQQESLETIKKLIEDGHRYHEQGQHRLSLQQYQKAIELAVGLRDRGLTAYLLQNAASEHRDCDNYHHAVDLLLTALVLVDTDSELVGLRASIKKLLAITFVDIFSPHKPEVLQLLEEARADYVALADPGQEANVLQHMGGAYLALDQLDKADTLLAEALNKAREANDLQLQGWILNNLAGLEIEQNEWGIALEYARNARDKVATVQDTEAIADTWVTEARVFVRMGQLDRALLAAQTALELYTRNQNLRRTIRARRHVAKVLVKLGRIDEAVAQLQEALKTAIRLDLRHDQAVLYLNLGEIELDRQNYGLAQEHAVEARTLAEGESLDKLSAEADDLRQRSEQRKR